MTGVETPGETLKKVEKTKDSLLNLFETLKNLEEIKFIAEKHVKIERSYRVNHKYLLNLFFSLALLKSTLNFMETLDKPTINFLKNTFPAVYRKLGLGLNARFLNRDLRELSGVKGIWKSDPKRNFFAHSGLLKDWVREREIDGEKELFYKKNTKQTIKAWLEDPED